MDMLKVVEKDQTVLIFGLFVLVCATILSIVGVSRLEEAYEARRNVSVAQDGYDELSMSIKDLQISKILKAQKDDEQTEVRELDAQARLQAALKVVNESIEGKNLQKEILALVQNDIHTLQVTPGPPRLSTVQKIEWAIRELNKAEVSSFDRRRTIILSSVESQMTLSVISLVIALVLIVIALRIKHVKDQLSAKTMEELKLLKEEAESASRMKSQFLSTVSHEIRTPLNGIIGLSRTLVNSQGTPNQKSFAHMIHQSGKTLLSIINDILDFSKIEAGRFEFVKADFSLLEVANQVLFTLSTKAFDKSLKLDYIIDPQIPKFVNGDSDRLAQVLFNLVGNAIKFTSSGSVTLRIQLADDMAGAMKVLFSVEDTGIGISESDLSQLFVPFTKAQQSGTSREAGTGLGLSISQSIIKAMGSEIKVKSTKGKGTIFHFEITFVQHSEERIGYSPNFKDSEQSRHDESVADLFHYTQPVKVLIVEDNPTNQVVAQTMLDKLNMDYVIVGDGKEALHVLENNKFDIILMDCQMPVMDGLQATQEIRRRNIQTPVVAMTANAYGEDKIKCIAAGMDDFLTKPVDPMALREVLQSQLKLKKKNFLEMLDETVGVDGRKKIVRAFLSTTDEFRKSFDSALNSKNLTDLHRLGHRFKSSALSVGGEKFGAMCSKIEQSESCEEITNYKQAMISELNKLEKDLQAET